VTNGDFERGDFSGWQTTGAVSVTSSARTGSYALTVGSSVALNGDSTASQTFVAPANMSQLSFWYKVVSPNDTVQYDWVAATLTDVAANTTSTVMARTCTNRGLWMQARAPITAGRQYRLTFRVHDDGNANDPTYAVFDDVQLLQSVPGMVLPVVTNGTFETGDLSGWQVSGANVSMLTPSMLGGCKSGTSCVQLGSTAATYGDSTITQKFMAGATASQLSFNYRMSCPGSVATDWITATLTYVDKNNNTITSTILPKTCAKTGAWTPVTTTVAPGTVYTLTITHRDNNSSVDPSYSVVDDVIMQ